MAECDILSNKRERLIAVAYPSLQYSVFQHTIQTQKHHIANPTQENSGKSAREHIVQQKIQYAPPLFAAILLPCQRTLRSGTP